MAAERETAEELGLSIDFSDRRPVITVNFSDGFDDFYTIEMDVSLDDLHLQKEEVADARWASREEIEAMIDDGSFIPYQKELLGYLFFARERRGTWNL
jgi:NADH pyrophosphatase NudC (nudix superfamily)